MLEQPHFAGGEHGARAQARRTHKSGQRAFEGAVRVCEALKRKAIEQNFIAHRGECFRELVWGWVWEPIARPLGSGLRMWKVWHLFVGGSRSHSQHPRMMMAMVVVVVVVGVHY